MITMLEKLGMHGSIKIMRCRDKWLVNFDTPCGDDHDLDGSVEHESLEEAIVALYNNYKTALERRRDDAAKAVESL